MAKAGWCAGCGANVWLNETGGCVSGHDASQISNVYESEAAAPASDTLNRAGDALGKAADEVSAGVSQAWEEAQPALQQAGENLGKAADEVADKAKELGGKIWAWGKKQASSDRTGDDL
jgi:phage-related minor tail protein